MKQEQNAMGKISQASTAPVLAVRNLGKEYKLYPSPRARLKALLTGRATHRSHWALRDVSFTLERGQCIGVIGDNGAGKSSLLKLLAGTMQPSVGSIERRGRITAILELGAGFHPDFSGRDNLYFAGSLIGIGHDEMRRLEPEIIDFSELREAIDRPVKTYSSGMTVRLAFALVTAVQPDVLIVDEALAVGDQSFQKKCIERILEFRRNGCTILFCSHSPYHIRHLCDRVLWMVRGQMHALGNTEQVLAAYEAASRGGNGCSGQKLAEPEPASLPVQRVQTREDAHLVAVQVQELGPGVGAEVPVLQSRDMVVLFRAHVPQAVVPSFGFMLEQLNGVGITSVAMHVEGVHPVRTPEGGWAAQLNFPDLPLHTGDYVVSAYLFDESGLVILDEWLRFQPLRVMSSQPLPGLVHLPHYWGAPL